MKLPGGDRALVDVGKLREYCLNERHPRGRHKARLFASILGLTREDAEILRQELLRAAVDGEASPSERDDYGQRYVVNFEMAGPSGSTVIGSIWIVLKGENYPRLITCYVL
jgi:hypothetical protein